MTQRIIGVLAAFATLACGGGEPRAGADRVSLIQPGDYVLGPAVAKDGRIAYARLVDGKANIFVADADGRNPRRVSTGNWDDLPIWSPDGRWIALSRDANGLDVVIVPSDSGAERVVADTPASEMATGWLPDGSLVFTRGIDTDTETWVYNASDGSSARLFAAKGSARGCPSEIGRASCRERV